MYLLKKPLEDYLRHKLGPDAVLVKQSRFTRGSSRVTWFVDYRESPDAPIQEVVFRGDHVGGSTISTELDQEYFMYERLSKTAVPVATARWWEEDPEWVERPFYVRNRVEGSWEIPHFTDPDPQYDDLRIEISKEHMRKLALVHNVDWRALGFQDRLKMPRDEADCAQNFLDVIEQQLAAFATEPVPVVVEAIAWLRRRAPVAPRISLCKGTNGLGEEVFRDGVIVAMSDWEEASIGDPAADFASLQNFMPEIARDGKSIWGLEQALAYYREVSSIPLTAESVRYYQIVRALSTMVFAHKTAVIVDRGNADIRQGWTAAEVFHFGKRALANAIGLMPPVYDKWFEELNTSIETQR